MPSTDRSRTCCSSSASRSELGVVKAGLDSSGLSEAGWPPSARRGGPAWGGWAVWAVWGGAAGSRGLEGCSGVFPALCREFCLPSPAATHPPPFRPPPCALQSRAGWLVGAGCGQARPPPPRFAPHHHGRPLTPPARALPLPPPQATAELPGAGAAERGEPSMTVRRPGTPRWGCVPVRVPLAVWPTRLAPPGQPRRYVGMGNGSSAPHAQPGSP